MAKRCAVLDDYQGVALEMADWSVLDPDVEVTVFREPFAGPEAAIEALRDFEIVCCMRERTPLPAAVIDALPKLELIVTTGKRNASIDIKAAAARGVPTCGTAMLAHPTAELVFAHILEAFRHVGYEARRMRDGEAWQSTVGRSLNGSTLGVIGLGRLGQSVARIAEAFGMTVIAWSPNLTEARAAEAGVTAVSKDRLLAAADVVTIHMVLSDRTRGLIGAADLEMMKADAILVNTSRGPIVDEAALIAALKAGQIGGAALDVFDTEPLPTDHPYRRLDRAQLSPHLGYVTEDNYRTCYSDTVECVRAWLDGAPVRVIDP